MRIDLASLASVRQFVADFRAKNLPLHLLINNAGGYQTQFLKTTDGFEWHFGVNHIGPFLLTNLLLDIIEKSAPARIINVASAAHKRKTIDFDNLNAEKGYSSIQMYGISKLCNILFTRELQRRLSAKGVAVTTYSLHPGVINTEIWCNVQGPLKLLLWPIKSLFFKTVEQGTATQIYLATASNSALRGHKGKYFVDSKVTDSSPESMDDKVARRLWEVS